MELEWPKMIETALTVEGDLGNTFNRFYEYSFMNQLLLRMQGLNEPVATYKTWQSIGRQVLKGSKAKEIVRPVIFNEKNDAGEVESRVKGFKLVRCIFALSETEGEELPPFELPAWDLDTALGKLDIKRVPFELLDGNTQGYAYDRNLAINPVATHPAKTMFHELGHIVLGHTDKENVHEYQSHRGLKEFQAEATAYLAMNELGQLPEDQASESRAYIQHWLRDEKPDDKAIRQVFVAVDSILKAGRQAVKVEDAI